MSLILDALNKADRERDHADAVPDLNTVHQTPRDDGDARHTQRLLLGISGFLSLLVVALLIAYFIKGRESLAPAAPRALSPGVPIVSTAPRDSQSTDRSLGTGDSLRAQPSPQRQPGKQAPRGNEEIEALYGAQVEEEVQKIVDPVVKTVGTEGGSPIDLDAGNSVDSALARALWEQSSRKPAPVVVPKPSPTPVPSAKPPVAEEPPVDAPREETLAAFESVPFLHNLPVSLQDTIPSLMYSDHQYEQSYVVINKREFREGDDVVAGVVLQTLLADGVVLQLDGLQFKLSALSSWVNY